MGLQSFELVLAIRLIAPWNPGDQSSVGLRFSVPPALGQANFQGGRSVMVMAVFLDQVCTGYEYYFDTFLDRVFVSHDYYPDFIQVGPDYFYLVAVYPDFGYHRFMLPLVTELQLRWGPGGWEFFEFFTQAEAKGGRSTKALAYVFDLVQVHLDHGCYRKGCHYDSSSTTERQVPCDLGRILRRRLGVKPNARREDCQRPSAPLGWHLGRGAWS